MLRSSSSASSAPHSLDQNLFGALRLPFAKQPARAFRHGKKKEEIKRRRNGIHAQHPAPVVFTRVQQKVVRKKGSGDAEHDHQLIERDHASAQLGRRNLSDINRRNQNGATHRNPAENPRADKNRKIGRQRG